LLLWGSFCALKAVAQVARRLPLVISAYTVNTQLPGGRITPIHPGLQAGTEFRYNRSEKNQWFQTAKLGVYYHKYSQTGIQLYSEIGYRRALWKRLGAEIRLGAGYLHAISDLQAFELVNGQYERKRTFGRPQVMGSAAFGLGYRLGSAPDAPRIFLDYQFFLQMPFVKSYVPLLPNTALHAGVAFPFFNRTKK
ncbi:MAG: hypothetical protein ACR2K1_01155, partial [Saprospiraceae bacterium]